MIKIKQRFKVLYQRNPKINEFMRDCDLFQGKGSGVYDSTVVTVTWKKGEVVDEKRIKKTIKNIKKAFEKQGCEVAEVTYI